MIKQIVCALALSSSLFSQSQPDKYYFGSRCDYFEFPIELCIDPTPPFDLRPIDLVVDHTQQTFSVTWGVLCPDVDFDLDFINWCRGCYHYPNSNTVEISLLLVGQRMSHPYTLPRWESPFFGTGGVPGCDVLVSPDVAIPVMPTNNRLYQKTFRYDPSILGLVSIQALNSIHMWNDNAVGHYMFVTRGLSLVFR